MCVCTKLALPAQILFRCVNPSCSWPWKVKSLGNDKQNWKWKEKGNNDMTVWQQYIPSGFVQGWIICACWWLEMCLCLNVHVAVVNTHVCDICNKYVLWLLCMCKEIILRSQCLAAVQIQGSSDILLIWIQWLWLYLAAPQLLLISAFKCYCSCFEPAGGRAGGSSTPSEQKNREFWSLWSEEDSSSKFCMQGTSCWEYKFCR